MTNSKTKKTCPPTKRGRLRKDCHLYGSVPVSKVQQESDDFLSIADRSRLAMRDLLAQQDPKAKPIINRPVQSTPNFYLGQQLPKTLPQTLYQAAPEYYDPRMKRWGKYKGWKSVGGAKAEAKKEKQLRVINQEQLGHTYTHCLTFALKVEVDQQQARAIIKTVKDAIAYFTRNDQDKVSYCWDIHLNRQNHFDWHFTFASVHDWAAMKEHIRKSVSKHHPLKGRQFEVKPEPYTDEGWLDYVGRVEKAGYHKDKSGNFHPIKDYYHRKRVLFSKDCKLRRHGQTANFWVKPKAELETIRKQSLAKIEQTKTEQYIADHPEWKEQLDRLANHSFLMFKTAPYLTSQAREAITLENTRLNIATVWRRQGSPFDPCSTDPMETPTNNDLNKNKRSNEGCRPRPRPTIPRPMGEIPRLARVDYQKEKDRQYSMETV